MTFDDMCKGLTYAIVDYAPFGTASSGLHIAGVARIMRFRDGRAKNEALPLGEVLRSIN
jgi:hypothetical protein